MKHEMRKIIGTRFCTIFFLTLFWANAYFFSIYLGEKNDDGFTFVQMKQMYEYQDALSEKESKLKNALLSAELDSNLGLICEDITTELTLIRATLERVKCAENYAQLLNSMIVESQIQLNSGIFSRDPFSLSTLKKTISVYEKLQGWVQPEIGFFGGVELLTSFPLTDLLILFFGCTVTLYLISAERSFGFLSISHPTKNGRGKLYCTKFVTMMGSLIIAMLGLYGTNIFMVVHKLGLGNLSAPVQSIFGMEYTPYAWTVLGYLVFCFSLKILWSFSICSLFFCICCATNGVFAAVGVGILTVLINIILRRSTSPLCYFLNFIYLSNTSDLLGSVYYLNIFSVPISLVVVSTVSLFLICILGFFVGGVLYCSLPAISASKRSITKYISMSGHTYLLGYELYKVLILNGGLLVLAGFFVLQIISYRNFKIDMTSWETYYRQYSSVLSGAPNEEKDTYLAEEQLRYDNLNKQLQKYAELCADDPQSFELLTYSIQNQLQGLRPFEEAKKQYQHLSGEQIYIYKSGYEHLFDDRGGAADIANTVKLILACIMGLAGIFSVETETGMICFHTAYASENNINKKKLLVIAIYLLFALIIAYLPQYVYISYNYELPYLNASANSLQIFGGMPNWCRIWMVFLFIGLKRLAIGVIACSTILFFSKKTKNTISTILICFAIMVLFMFFLILV